MGEREQQELEIIKARLAQVRGDMAAGRSPVVTTPFTMEQLGLDYPVVDEQGRFWRRTRDGFVLMDGEPLK